MMWCYASGCAVYGGVERAYAAVYGYVLRELRAGTSCVIAECQPHGAVAVESGDGVSCLVGSEHTFAATGERGWLNVYASPDAGRGCWDGDHYDFYSVREDYRW